MENKIIHKCNKCSKIYKSKGSLDKHSLKCNETKGENKPKENNYDVNMTINEDHKVEIEVKKQNEDGTTEEGVKVLRNLLKPTVSESYQEEIDKLEALIKMFSDYPVPEKAEDKDTTIEQLKNIISIIMSQSKNLIKEMKEMSKRNIYYKNNIMLAAFILDKCRKDVPENDEEFDNMFD